MKTLGKVALKLMHVHLLEQGGLLLSKHILRDVAILLLDLPKLSLRHRHQPRVVRRRVFRVRLRLRRDGLLRVGRGRIRVRRQRAGRRVGRRLRPGTQAHRIKREGLRLTRHGGRRRRGSVAPSFPTSSRVALRVFGPAHRSHGGEGHGAPHARRSGLVPESLADVVRAKATTAGAARATSTMVSVGVVRPACATLSTLSVRVGLMMTVPIGRPGSARSGAGSVPTTMGSLMQPVRQLLVILLEQLLQRARDVVVSLVEEAQRPPDVSDAARSADAVDVVVEVRGEVVVDDQGHARDVQATGCDIRGHQAPDARLLKRSQGGLALALGLVAVDAADAEAAGLQLHLQAVRTSLGLDEHQRQRGRFASRSIRPERGAVGGGHFLPEAIQLLPLLHPFEAL
eukprot:scaffold3541_cov252-Pinguiococcus_pyrenoidosus.AAC.6